MTIKCVWEHNGVDSLLYAVDLPGAYTRGEGLETALGKMPGEIRAYLKWAGESVPENISVEVIQDAACFLEVRDADSDVLFETEKVPLTCEEYTHLKALALKSAADFHSLYTSIPDKAKSNAPIGGCP